MVQFVCSHVIAVTIQLTTHPVSHVVVHASYHFTDYFLQVNYGKGNLATINNDMIKGSLKVCLSYNTDSPVMSIPY